MDGWIDVGRTHDDPQPASRGSRSLSSVCGKRERSMIRFIMHALMCVGFRSQRRQEPSASLECDQERSAAGMPAVHVHMKSSARKKEETLGGGNIGGEAKKSWRLSSCFYPQTLDKAQAKSSRLCRTAFIPSASQPGAAAVDFLPVSRPTRGCCWNPTKRQTARQNEEKGKCVKAKTQRLDKSLIDRPPIHMLPQAARLGPQRPGLRGRVPSNPIERPRTGRSPSLSVANTQ